MAQVLFFLIAHLLNLLLKHKNVLLDHAILVCYRQFSFGLNKHDNSLIRCTPGIAGFTNTAPGTAFGAKSFFSICVASLPPIIPKGGRGALNPGMPGIKFGNPGFSGVGHGGSGRPGKG